MNLFMFVILIIIHLVTCDSEVSNSPFIDVESQTTTINLSSIDDYVKVSTKSVELKNDLSKSKVLELKTESTNISKINDKENEINETSVPKEDNVLFNNSINWTSDNNHQNETIKILITNKDPQNYTFKITEIKKDNQTLLSTILLRMHSIVQYSGNVSSQVVIPYVYLAKIQIDGLFKQVSESTFLRNYVSNVFKLLVDDLMNKECNAVSTMMNYVVVPAIEARGASNNYLVERARELADGVSRWHNALQRWSAHLSSLFSKISDLRFEDCGRKFLCALGKAKYQSVREEPRKMNKARTIQFLNNLFK